MKGKKQNLLLWLRTQAYWWDASHEQGTRRKSLTMSDEDIDYSDIPPLDEEFSKKAKLVKANGNQRTEQISIRVDTEVLEWF